MKSAGATWQTSFEKGNKLSEKIVKCLRQSSFLTGGVSRSRNWRAVLCVFITSVLMKHVVGCGVTRRNKW